MFTKICYYAFGLSSPLYLHYSIPLVLYYDKLKKLLEYKIFGYLLLIMPVVVMFIRIVRNDTFFLSDDFAHLAYVSTNSYLDIVNVALGPGIWVGHHIILGFWLFKLIFDLFGTDVMAFNFVMFSLNLINTLLLYKLLNKILKSNASLLIGIIFGTFYISWISNIHEVLAGTFLLLSIIFTYDYLKKPTSKYLRLTILFYILAILTKEITFLYALIVPILMLHHQHSFKIKTKPENLKLIAIILIIFILYSVFYAKGFLYYFGIKETQSYQMEISAGIISRNIWWYLTDFAKNLNYSPVISLAFLTAFVLHDFYKKKLEVLPFVLAYFILLSPALLLVTRNAHYYNYLPSIFLLIAIYVLINNIFTKLVLVSKGHVRKVLMVYTILIVLIGIFGIDKFLLDNCFLIQNPWGSERKLATKQLVSDLEMKLEEGGLKQGEIIKLNNTEHLEDLLDSGVIHLLLNSKYRNLRFIYLKDSSELKRI